MDGACLNQVKEQRDLGILISHDLSPRSHISEFIKKANQRVYIIKNCFTNLAPHKRR